MEKSYFYITPLEIDIDGVPVTVWEVLRTQLINGEVWYHFVVSINFKGIESRRVTIDARNMDELVEKLRTEITKLKVIYYARGINEVKRVIT